MKAIVKLLLVAAVVTGSILVSETSYAQGPYACQVHQTSAGDFGVREYRPSGWVYVIRQLTYEQAEQMLEQLRTFGRCF